MEIFIPYQGIRGGFTPRNVPEVNEGEFADCVGREVKVYTSNGLVYIAKIKHTDYNSTILEDLVHSKTIKFNTKIIVGTTDLENEDIETLNVLKKLRS